MIRTCNSMDNIIFDQKQGWPQKNLPNFPPWLMVYFWNKPKTLLPNLFLGGGVYAHMWMRTHSPKRLSLKPSCWRCGLDFNTVASSVVTPSWWPQSSCEGGKGAPRDQCVVLRSEAGTLAPVGPGKVTRLSGGRLLMMTRAWPHRSPFLHPRLHCGAGSLLSYKDPLWCPPWKL